MNPPKAGSAAQTRNLPSDIFLITKRFESRDELGEHIEHISKSRGIGIMEAVLEFCDKDGLDVAAIGSMLPAPLKKLIEAEANALNLLKPDATPTRRKNVSRKRI